MFLTNSRSFRPEPPPPSTPRAPLAPSHPYPPPPCRSPQEGNLWSTRTAGPTRYGPGERPQREAPTETTALSVCACGNPRYWKHHQLKCARASVLCRWQVTGWWHVVYAEYRKRDTCDIPIQDTSIDKNSFLYFIHLWNITIAAVIPPSTYSAKWRISAAGTLGFSR